MPKEIRLSTYDVLKRVCDTTLHIPTGSTIYPVLRGGYAIALALKFLRNCIIVDDPKHALFIVDDVIASGETRDKFAQYSAQFYAPYAVLNNDVWLIFPWEKSKEDDAVEIYTRLLQHSGADVNAKNIAGIAEAVKSFCATAKAEQETQLV